MDYLLGVFHQLLSKNTFKTAPLTSSCLEEGQEKKLSPHSSPGKTFGVLVSEKVHVISVFEAFVLTVQYYINVFC